jgi:tight adherence protein B
MRRALAIGLASLGLLAAAPGAAAEGSASEGAGEFGTVLAIDASASMSGRPIEGAMNAARAFEQYAGEQQLAVVTFNQAVTSALSPTADEAEIASALAAPPALDTGTRLYDAVAQGIGLLDGAGIEAGAVVLLSDGTDTGSTLSEQEVVSLAAQSGIRIFVVGLRSGQFDPATLKGLVYRGSYADAKHPGQLMGIFEEFGERLAAESRREATGFWGSAGTMAGAAGLVALLLAGTVAVLARPRRSSVAARMQRFIGAGGPGNRTEGPPEEDGNKTGRLLAPLERRLEGREWWARFKQELDVAGIEIPAVRLVAGTALLAMVAMVLIAGLTGAAILAPLGLVVIWGVRVAIARKLRRARDAFAEQLADNLQVVASALRAGHSLAGALGAVVEEASEPARGEFRRIVNDERLGVPLETAIRRVARRMANRDMEQVALVATIQRETGGNTAEILDTVIHTIRERGDLRRLMNTLTAQGRISRAIVTAVPVFLLAAITLINPAYMEPMYNTGSGQVLLALAAGLVILGSLAIRRIVDIKV